MATSPSAIGSEQHFVWLRGIVAAVLMLNLLDIMFTLTWIFSGVAEEANPLLRELVHESPVAFTLAKLGLVGLGSALLWRHRRRPLAVVAIFVAFLAYYAILLWHLGFAGLTIGYWLVP